MQAEYCTLCVLRCDASWRGGAAMPSSILLTFQGPPELRTRLKTPSRYQDLQNTYAPAEKYKVIRTKTGLKHTLSLIERGKTPITVICGLLIHSGARCKRNKRGGDRVIRIQAYNPRITTNMVVHLARSNDMLT